jgi:quinol monooxygenase YgiN
MLPKRGQANELDSLLDKLVDYYSEQPGFITGYRLKDIDGSGRVGRLGVWEDEHAAEAAAQSDHDLALRSQLNMVVDEDTHEEYSFEGIRADQM